MIYPLQKKKKQCKSVSLCPVILEGTDLPTKFGFIFVTIQWIQHLSGTVEHVYFPSNMTRGRVDSGQFEGKVTWLNSVLVDLTLVVLEMTSNFSWQTD